MKWLFLNILSFLTGIGLSAQDISISFQPKVAGTQIDTIWITNQRTNQKVKLSGNETLTLTKVTGVNSLTTHYENGLLFPNPFNGRAELSFSTSLNQQVKVVVSYISGQILSTDKQFLISGQHRFKITFPQAGIYNVAIQKKDGLLSFKAICLQTNYLQSNIQYLGTEHYYSAKNAKVGKTMSYAQGDILNCSAFSGKNNTIIADSPTTSKVYSVEFYECKDPDNNNYPIVQIGTQWWMVENLKTTKNNDSTAIPNVTDNSGWSDVPTTDAYCWYNNDVGNKTPYGALYNVIAVNNGKLCPVGWHVATNDDWHKMILFLDPNATQGINESQIAGGMLKETGSAHWMTSNIATNESGFTAVAGGIRYNDTFAQLGNNANYWSSGSDYQVRLLISGNNAINKLPGAFENRHNGNSVRCIKN